MQKRKVKAIATSCALAGVLAVGGSLAYFTDGDSATNNFTLGRVAIDLTETNWDEDNAKDIIPDQEIEKNPQITNVGINDAYVYAAITVPYANVAVANEDGTEEYAGQAKRDTQLFTYDLDSNWTLIESGTIDGNTIGDTSAISHATGTKGYVDTVGKTITYVYAYTGADSATLEAIAKDQITENVFPAVKLVNLMEDNLEESAQKIDIKAYGIQSDLVDNGDSTIEGNNGAGKTDPTQVWAIVQNSSDDGHLSVLED